MKKFQIRFTICLVLVTSGDFTLPTLAAEPYDLNEGAKRCPPKN